DAQNRLRSATGPAAIAQFYYDGLNRQVARSIAPSSAQPTPPPVATPTPIPTPTPIATPSPLPTASPLPTVPPLGTPTPAPTATPTPTPQCSPVTFNTAGSYPSSMQ